MWYYGDLTIYGENRINNLVPGEDKVNKGIDYYNCFYTLYHKLYAHFENQCKNPYPLLEYDLFTIWDLAYSRQVNNNVTPEERFFYSRDEKKVEIYTCIEDILDKYIQYYCTPKVSAKDENVYEEEKIDMNVKDVNVPSAKGAFEKIIAHLDEQNIKSDERYVHCFFRVIKQLFPESK